MKSLFKINLYTYLILILSFFSGYFREIIIVYLILFIHELGHYFVMNLFSIKVRSITFYPYGGKIDSDILINTNSKKVLIISISGILMQLLLYLIVFILYKINIIDTYYYSIINMYNLYIMLFNLLPIYPLDGFKILNCIFEMIFPYIKSLKLSLMINVIFMILFLLYLYLFKINNYIIIIYLIVSFINYFKNINYMINKFYLERYLYDLKLNGLVSVNSKENMFKNMKNYINGIDEKRVLKMFDMN